MAGNQGAVLSWGVYSYRLRRRMVKNKPKLPAKKDEDTRKEQISLCLGTAEYNEYVEDKQTHKLKSDEQHIDMEAANAQAAQAMLAEYEAGKSATSERAVQRHLSDKIKKSDLSDDAIKRAADIAKKTPGKADDERVKRASVRIPERFEHLIADDGVDEDEFLDKAAEDALSGPDL